MAPPATPLLEQIANALIAKAAAIPGIVHTGLLTDVGKLWEEEDGDVAFYLGLTDEANDPSPTRSISPVATFFFHTIVKGDAPTRTFIGLYRALKNALDLDPTLGGLANAGAGARVSGVQGFNTSALIAQRTHVTDVFIEVEYRHDRGAA